MQSEAGAARPRPVWSSAATFPATWPDVLRQIKLGRGYWGIQLQYGCEYIQVYGSCRRWSAAGGETAADGAGQTGCLCPSAWRRSRGLEIARALQAPLDLIFVRKIGAPHAPEVALGAVIDGKNPQTVVNENVRRQSGADEDFIERASKRELAELERRRALLSGQPRTGGADRPQCDNRR